MARILIAALLAVGLAARGHAVGVKLGYGNITGDVSFEHVDNSIVTTPRTTKTEDIGIGVITIGAEHMVALDDMFAIGLEIGGSTGGEFKLDETKRVTPAAGQPNDNDGDSTTVTIHRVPILARANVQFPMSGMTVVIGLGAGIIIAPWTSETVDQEWWDGTPPIGDKTSTRTTKYGKRTTWDSGTVGLFALEIAPGIEMKMGEKTTIGLEIPLSITSEATRSGMEYQREIAQTNVPNPEVQADVWKVGGFDWGIRLVYSRKL